jgi:hypothetical protein
MKYIHCFVIVISFLFVYVHADNDSKKDIVLLKDGSLIRAQIVEEKVNSIIIALDDSWKEINRDEILKIEKSGDAGQNNQRAFKITAGFCTNYIVGYDYHDKAGYGAGPGFRIGYGVNITQRFLAESSYTYTIHESDTTNVEDIYLNSLDLNLKYIFLKINKVSLYANIGMGLDLFSSKGPDIGMFSYIPHFGIGSYVNINDWSEVEFGFNLHPVRFETNEDHKPDATYLQFIILVNFKL